VGAPGVEVPLRSGWEADTPVDDTMSRQALFAVIARAEHAARGARRPWSADDEVALAALGLPGRFGNHAVLLRPPGDEAVLERIDGFFGPEPYLIWSPFPTGDLRHRGLQLLGHPPLMYLAAGSRSPVTADGLLIEEVTDGAGLARFERVLVDAYPLPEWAELPRGSVFPPSTLGSGVARYWLGSAAGRTVCTSMSIVHAGVNLVEWVSTHPAARGRGYGAAVTWAAATAAPELPAVLVASDEGRPVYERMGFVALARWTLWTRPSVLHS
jgi:hypothetical protein